MGGRRWSSTSTSGRSGRTASASTSPPTTGASTVSITIDDVVVPEGTPIGPALAAVGFSEIDTGLAADAGGRRSRRPMLSLRVRAAGDAPRLVRAHAGCGPRPTDRWRSDPEPTMVRDVELPAARTLEPAVTVRLDQRASDAVLAGLLGIDGPQASSRLVGASSAAGWAATDGDPATAWQTPFAGAVGATLDLTATAPIEAFQITQLGGDHSPVTAVRLARR